MTPTMKPHYKPLATALAAALQLAAIAAVPVAWTNSPGMPPYPIKPVPHGSTVDLAVTLKGYTTPPIADGADVRLWYQTNGMGSAWWSAPATFDGSTITANFGPAQDCGADRVSLFFGAPSNVFASAVLRLTHAPGFTPSSLPPPPGVAMQPWVAEQLAALAVAATNYTDQALIDTIKLSEFKPEENPRLVFWDFDATWENPRLAHPTEFRVSDIVPGDYAAVSNAALTAGPAATNYTNAAIPPAISNVVTKSYVEDLGITSEEEDPVWAAEKPNYATKRALGAVTNDLEALRTESALVYRLYSGSNVVAEVTNYNSQVHAPSLRLMQLNESNEYFTVWAETNGLARTLNSATAYTDSATNELKNIYAPRAWSRTTSGLGSDAPANTTWISTPRTVIAGGLEYAKIVDTYGEVWVLTSNGMAMDFDPDSNAYFRITADDGTPVFSIEKSDAQVVGAYAEGITVSANSVTMPVPVVSAEAPTMYWRNQLESGDWSDQTTPPTGATVTWSGSAGSWVCTVTFSGARPQSMFFKFSFIQEGGVVIRNNATTDLSSGIWVNGTKFVPTVSGNNLIWTKQ